jgi:cobalt/nickel transport system permease protein
MELFSEYFRKNHILSRVDARIKLLVALIILIMVLSYKGFALPVLVTLVGLVFCVVMKIPLRNLFLRFSEPCFLAATILLLKVFFSGNTILFSVDLLGLRIYGYQEGLMEGLMIGSRILGAVSITAILGFSTPFTEFMAGLSWFKVPKGFIEVLMFAYRYIFVLLEDATVVYNAQKNRLGYSNIRHGLGSFGILTGSLILRAFDHSQNITTAMVQRGYDGHIPILKHKSFKPSEIAVSALVVVAMGFVWKIQ